MQSINRRRKGTANTLAALKSIRAARPDGAPIHIILDNLSAHTGVDIRRWAKKHKVELCFTPTYASWANPIEAHFGPLRQFTPTNSNHRNPAQTRALHRYLPWRTSTPVTPTCSPPSARNVPASAARRASAGADRKGNRNLVLEPADADSGRLGLRPAGRPVLVQEMEERHQRVFSIGMPLDGISRATRHRPASTSAQPLGEGTTGRQGERLVDPVNGQSRGIADQDVLQVPQAPLANPHGGTQPNLVQDVLDVPALVDRPRTSADADVSRRTRS
jgi:hypothetical protein